MIVETARFGPLEVPNDKLITMERPILGFESLSRFCLIERDDLTPFYWMQSIQDPSVAFLVVNPRVFFPDYRIEVNSKEIAELNVAQVQSVETYVVVTLHEDAEQITANLQGPILINTENNLAKQLVLVNSEYKVKHSLVAAVTESDVSVEAEELVTVEL
jgi:flagellar assembly factor FliW